MKYADKIKAITKKAEKNMKKELKAIKKFKRIIKRNAKHRKHSVTFYIDKDDMYNITFIVTHLKDESFQITLDEHYFDKGKYLQWIIICEW